jgi:HlyD family secretion protein
MNKAHPPRSNLPLAASISDCPSTNPTLPNRRAAARFARWAVVAAVAVGLVAVVRYGWSTVLGSEDAEQPLTAPVTRATLRVIVTERGNLESVKTVDGVCEVSGRENKIIFIVPEGQQVEKGDVVVRFDTAEIDQQIAQQQIKVQQAKVKVQTTQQETKVKENEGESKIADAVLERDLAELDLEKYSKGDYAVEENDLLGQIELAEGDLTEAEELRKVTETLMKKGFRTPEQLRKAERNVAQMKYFLERDKHKLEVLQKYDQRRKLTEFKAKLEQAKRKVEREQDTAKAEVAKAKSEFESAKATLGLEDKELARLTEQKDKCEIKAEQDGVVAYANEYYWDSSRQIREGSIVYFRQKIFSLPDMSAMQVKVNVHESLIKKVKPDQKAEIRVESFPNERLTGTVKSVSPLADSTRAWAQGGVKEYTTIVTVDKMPKEQLKPGMTAEVKILVNELADVLTVPVQAVTEHEGKHYAYVQSGAGIARREVEVGDNNQKFVEVVEGLAEGEQVCLDARQRGIDDFQSETAPAGGPESSEPAPGTLARSDTRNTGI